MGRHLRSLCGTNRVPEDIHGIESLETHIDVFCSLNQKISQKHLKSKITNYSEVYVYIQYTPSIIISLATFILDAIISTNLL